jgi:Flp pilus assembly protein TadB
LGAHIAEGNHMNILDRIFVGEVIQDFGIIKDETLGVGRMRKSALLAKKNGKFRFVIKTSAFAFLAASVNYTEFDLEDAYKIRQWIEQSESIVKGFPYSESFSASGISKELPTSAILSALVTFVLGSLIIWWLSNSILILLATLVLFLLLINMYQDFQRHEEAADWQAILPGLFAVTSLFLGLGKFILMNFF